MEPETVIGVSIEVPEPYAAVLRGARESFGDPLALRVPPHITLVPPTPVAPAELPAIIDHLARAATMVDPFRVRLRGTGTFRPVTPVVFLQVAEGIGPCSLLEEKVRRAPLERELFFPYHPHVTVAHNLDDAALDHAFKELADFHAVFECADFTLSAHGPDEVWHTVRDFPLGPRVTAPPAR
ncbi:2'-5' RNA ligase family protein [Actinocorallia sp. API 0066]|uniref:2'-5' RNA ligase family protein n=1 Tax=Actinocorallia sp. API 0066 TaxID=2896846 RepID=UPI001E50F650|nr:2'-5' RNA ligase family protein [Actinocorallia sp. API 0066]MCD0453127.1 2'-5' RNA ligase family protein [Actinocorallia sp. API 0066]